MSEGQDRKYLTIQEVLRALADGKTLSNSEYPNLKQKVIENYLYIGDKDVDFQKKNWPIIDTPELTAKWWEVEPEPKWKEVKWWEALEWAEKNRGKTFQFYGYGPNGWVECRWEEKHILWSLIPYQMVKAQWRIPMEVQ